MLLRPVSLPKSYNQHSPVWSTEFQTTPQLLDLDLNRQVEMVKLFGLNLIQLEIQLNLLCLHKK